MQKSARDATLVDIGAAWYARAFVADEGITIEVFVLMDIGLPIACSWFGRGNKICRPYGDHRDRPLRVRSYS